MKNEIERSCVTDYEAVYAKSYYAHEVGLTSFGDVTFSGSLMEEIALFSKARGLLDIGGGNGSLASSMQGLGFAAFTVDAQDRVADDYLRMNLGVFDQAEADTALAKIEAALPDDYVATCFDVAEHIDAEHIADFLLNLNHLTKEYLVISISTRPSSMGNRYHSTVLPGSTWISLLEQAGFEVARVPRLDSLQPERVWSEASENIWAVAHWQRVNPFRESANHQLYLKCRKTMNVVLKKEFATTVNAKLDIGYRNEKRLSIARYTEFPNLIFHVAFWQDWSFLRSIMDVWPRENLQVILRTTYLLDPLKFIARNYLRRVNVYFVEYGTVSEGIAQLRSMHIVENSVFLNCTAGPDYPPHLAAARIALEAQNMGIRTLCVQHGLTAPKGSLPGTDDFWVWGQEFLETHALATDSLSNIAVGGSPKLCDAQIDQSPDAFGFRIGQWSTAFDRVVMIGLSLHSAHLHQDGNKTRKWVENLCRDNRDTLFVLRPHPEDKAVYQWDLTQTNVLLLDDITLTTIDWPVSRLLKSVDLLITVPSTLLLDGLACDIPVAVYGLEDYTGPKSAPLERVLACCHQVGSRLKLEYFQPKTQISDFTCFKDSRSFFSNLLEYSVSKTKVAPVRLSFTRIFDWSANFVPVEMTSRFTLMNEVLEKYISRNGEHQTETSAVRSVEDHIANFDKGERVSAETIASVQKEIADLQAKLRHAKRYPWKYLKGALTERRKSRRD